MHRTIALAVALTLAGPVAAFGQARGNAAAGEEAFRQCTTCHGIVSPDGTVIHRQSPTGPNLWGVAGRRAGSHDGYSRYSSAIKAAGEAGIVWDQANFVGFVTNPTEYLRGVTGDNRARSNMNHRLRGSAEDLFAYLVQFGSN